MRKRSSRYLELEIEGNCSTDLWATAWFLFSARLFIGDTVLKESRLSCCSALAMALLVWLDHGGTNMAAKRPNSPGIARNRCLDRCASSFFPFFRLRSISIGFIDGAGSPFRLVNSFQRFWSQLWLQHLWNRSQDRIGTMLLFSLLRWQRCTFSVDQLKVPPSHLMNSSHIKMDSYKIFSCIKRFVLAYENWFAHRGNSVFSCSCGGESRVFSKLNGLLGFVSAPYLIVWRTWRFSRLGTSRMGGNSSSSCSEWKRLEKDSPKGLTKCSQKIRYQHWKLCLGCRNWIFYKFSNPLC